MYLGYNIYLEHKIINTILIVTIVNMYLGCNIYLGHNIINTILTKTSINMYLGYNIINTIRIVTIVNINIYTWGSLATSGRDRRRSVMFTICV